MTGKLHNYQVQMLDCLTKMEAYRKQLEANGFTTIDGETYTKPHDGGHIGVVASYKGFADVADYINAAPDNKDREARKVETFGIRYGMTGRLPSFPETQRIGRATRPAPNPGAMVIVDYAATEERLMSMAARKQKPKSPLKSPFKRDSVVGKWWPIGMASTAIIVARLARGAGNGEA